MHTTAGCNINMFGMPEFHHWMTSMRSFMPYDLQETNQQYIVEMPLPGYESKNIEVSVRGTQIAIDASYDGESPQFEGKNPQDFMRMGAFFWKRPIHVKIDVAEEIDPAKVKARLNRGILHIEFEKIPMQSIPIEDQEG